MIKKESKALDWLMIVLITLTVFDPANKIFGAKTLVFSIMIIGYLLFRGIKISKINISLLILILLIPLLYLMWGYNNITFNAEESVIALKSFLYFSIILIFKDNKEIYMKYFKIILCGLPVIILMTHLSLIINRDIFDIIYNYTMNKGCMIIATTRNFGSIEMPSLYYKTVILTIVPYSYHLKKLIFEKREATKNLFLTVLFGYGLLLSGTRATITCLLMITGFWTLNYIVENKKYNILIIFMIFGIIMIVYFGINFFEKTEISNNIKLGHIKSYFNHFKTMNLLIGDGLGTSFYTEGFKSYTYITELTYFEMFRRFGIFGFSILLIWLLYPLKVLYKNKEILSWYPVYLMAAGTNPLLFSSTGMLLLVFVYAEVIETKRNGVYGEREIGSNSIINL